MQIITATADDAAEIARVLEELDSHYGATEFQPFSDRVATVERMLFGSVPAAYVLLARSASAEALGLASYSFHWPAVGLTHSLFLKELYVCRSARRNGVGKALMKALCQIASDASCSRVEWNTETSN